MNKKLCLGRRIREIRKSKKISQEQLAEMISLEPPSICNIERGKNYPTLQNLERIVEILGTTFTEIFDYEHQKSNEELIEEINNILANNTDKIRKIYRVIVEIIE